MVRIAAGIDVGTNSVKIAVGKIEPDGAITILHDSSVNVRLGAGSDATKRLQPEGQERAIEALRVQLATAREMDVEAVRLVGTSAIRDAENRDEFVARVKSELGVELEPISEQDEARLAYQSVTLDPKLRHYDGDQLVVDIGGGSTEMIFGRGGKTTLRESLKIGAVRLTERFLKPEKGPISQLDEAAAFAEEMIAELCIGMSVGRVVGVGGSVVNLARMMMEVSVDHTEEVHTVPMSYRDIRQLMHMLCALSPEERKKLIGLEPERADIILGGTVILERLLALLGAESIVVSTRGLRHAVLYELLGSHAG